MESLVVHPKNQMELNALKSTLKEMGIRFEKFHTRNTKTTPNQDLKAAPRKESKPARNFKEKPKTYL